MPEAEGPYEIMPYKEIVQLKRDLEELQKKQGEVPSRELLKSIDNLTKNMNSMLGLFKAAAEDMKIEEKAAPEVDLDPVLQKLDELSARVDEISGKVDELTPENKAIAEGIIALSDDVNQKLADLSDAVKGAKPPKSTGLPPMLPGGPMPPGGAIPPGEPPLGPPGMPPGGPPGPIPPGGPPLGPGGIEGTLTAGGPAPSRLPKWSMPPGGPPLGPPGAPPGGPLGAPPKKKPFITFGKKK